MNIFSHIEEWNKHRRELKTQSIGFVPTMGALHAGHASLLKRAKQENDICVLSVFVNPTQFDDPNDLKNYPVTLDADMQMALANGVTDVILPNAAILYRDQYKYKVSEHDISQKLCGLHRPGHFDGVLTVVMKLLNIVRPTRAYFGEKDFQQLTLIEGMVEAFFMDTQIIRCPTLREADGLAMSSRNQRLDAHARQRAPLFAQILREAPSTEKAKVTLAEQGFDVDYVEDLWGRRLGAIRVPTAGDVVRLIDNIPLETPHD
jgi:pantoate--beta-alanine ligase